MLNLNLAEETDGYQTVTDPSNTDKRLLIAGSQNVFISQQKKVTSRPGYTRLGPANPALLTSRHNGWTWNTSSGPVLSQHAYNGILEVYLSTVDGVAVNAFVPVSSAFNASAMVRPALTEVRSGGGWYDSTESIDVQIMVQGDDTLFEWSGGVAVVASVSNATGTIGIFDQPNAVGVAFDGSGGVDYVLGDVLTVTGGTAQITVDAVAAGGVKTTQMHSPGSGYLVNDVIELVPQGGSPAFLRVLTVDGGGAVLTYKIVTAGSGYTADVGVTVLTTSSNGTGFSVNITAVGNTITAWHLSTNGAGYAPATNVALTGGSGTGAALNIISAGSFSITKAGTTTFAQNRFYTARNKAVVCVRTQQVFTYTSDGNATTITGLNADPTGLVAGDILVQQIVTNTAQPVAGRKNDIPFIFQNQLVLGSESDAQTYISKNTAYTDFTFSAPRLSGEGGLLTLDGFCRAINALGNFLLVFAGRNTIFRGDYQQISVSNASGTGIVAETLDVQRFDVGINQGALNHECVLPIGQSQLAYLTNEVTLRTINAAQTATGLTVVFGSLDSKTLSNPIKPDFDAETWENAFGMYYKNTLLFTAYATSHMYMLNYIQDANGKTLRFWNPPQILPVGAMNTIDIGDGNGPTLYGHSNVVPETYKLFDGLSDGQYTNMDVADKLPIHAIARFAYDPMGKRGILKTLDEYYTEGEINPNTKDLLLTLLYDFEGSTQILERTIDGTDPDILEGSVNNNSVAQSLLASQPLGGLLVAPPDATRFRINFEIAREDFFELSAQFETNDVDRYWGILAQGSNASLSPRKTTTIKK